MRQGLFRKQALDHQQQRLPGQVLLTPRLHYPLLTCCLLIWIAVLGYFLFTSQYRRHTTVTGWLEPAAGQLRLHAQRYGNLSALWVSEGDQVVAGDRLFSIVTPDAIDTGDSANQAQLEALQSQTTRIVQQQQHMHQLHIMQREQLTQRITAIEEERTAITHILTLTRQRLDILNSKHHAALQLVSQGHLPRHELSGISADLLTVKQELGQSGREEARLHHELVNIRQQLKQLPDEQAKESLLLANQHSELRQRIVQLKNQTQQVVLASSPGTISHIDVFPGQQVSPGQVVLSITPASSDLIGRLIVPAHAAGFIEHGQSVDLRYDAFPYQKFGQARGTVSMISDSIVLPGDWPDAPVSVTEPGYLVRVSLEDMHISAYGKPVALKSGMTFSADVNLSERSLIEWLLEPLLSITGRFQ
ncbi:HlyD family secretion protein [Alteromonas sp. CYL-A6]|uniref:HlyD family secretion protein n=1 Tax=Alteromonas nitratireducens TaxID=3390813 RepID=UPI0034B5B5BC